MGFFSKLARKLINKTDDDEAIRMISREQLRHADVPLVQPRPNGTPELPPPRRVEMSAQSAVPPPTALLPPERTTVTMNEPPPGTTEYNLEQMEDSFRNAPMADYSRATIAPDGTIAGTRFPTRNAPLPPPTRTTMPIDTANMPAPPPMSGPPNLTPERAFVGESYRGMSPADRAATYVNLRREAPAESKIKDTGTGYEVLPPQKMGRLRAMGEGFRQLMGAGAQYGTGGIVGAGAVGAIQGLISPGTIQNRGRDIDIARGEQQLARAQGLEEQQLQNQSRRLANLRVAGTLANEDDDRALELSREVRQEYHQGLSHIAEMQKAQSLLDPKTQQYADAERAIQQEAERLSKRTGRKVSVIPGNPALNQLPRFEIDGQIVQQQHDGKWTPVYGTPKGNVEDENADQKATYEWQLKNAENEAKRGAALQEATALEETATNHQQKVTAIAGQISTLDAQMAKMSSRDPALGPLKRQRQQLKEAQSSEQKAMEAAYKKVNELKSEATKYPAIPAPPKRVRRSKTKAGASLSKSAWERAHPGGNWQAAVEEANRRQIPIIP